MELCHLRELIEGLDSLAAVEEHNPVLGLKLKHFVSEVEDCCEIAYDNFSQALGKVRSLPSKPTVAEIDSLCNLLNGASSSKWFKKVNNICARLAALASEYKPSLTEQIRYASQHPAKVTSVREPVDDDDVGGPPDDGDTVRLSRLLSLLEMHEASLQTDIARVTAKLQTMLGPAKSTGDEDDDEIDSATTRNVEGARAYSLSVQDEISTDMEAIHNLSAHIKGGGSGGAEAILESEAAKALQRPERVLILNMFFVVVALSLGATAIHFLNLRQFVLITSFALTSVVVLNAFYLKSIDKLSEAGFLKLMQLALLKFFAPLARRN